MTKTGGGVSRTEQIPPPLASVLATFDRHAFGIAIGTVSGLGVFSSQLPTCCGTHSRG